MSNRIADLRTTLTLDDTDRMMEEYARVAAQKAALEARIERRIVELKAAEQPKIDNLDAAMTGLADAIAAYIATHPDEFQRPRTRKTSFGEYGLRAATSLDVPPDNLPDLLADLVKDQKTDCYRESLSLVRPACLERIQISAADESFFRAHGVAIKTGDTVVLKVSKSLIDQARKHEVAT